MFSLTESGLTIPLSLFLRSLWQSSEELKQVDQPTQRNRWYSPPTIVNAFYMPEFNSITFPAGILQPPFYRANSLQALNYGGIGQVSKRLRTQTMNVKM